MHEEAKTRVFGAVRRCLDRCYNSVNPLVQATEFVDGLRRSPQWSSREADEVETLVLKAVKVIVKQPRTDCCHEWRKNGPSSSA